MPMKGKSVAILVSIVAFAVLINCLAYFGIDISGFSKAPETQQVESTEQPEDAETTETPEAADETAENIETPENTENAETAENVEATESTETAENTENAEIVENTETPETTETVETPEVVKPSKKLFGIQNIKQGLDLKGGVAIVYEADKANPTTEELDSAKKLIRGRLDRKGYTEAEVAIQGTNRLSVDIPGVGNAEEAISDIGKTAMLYFADIEGNILLTGEHVQNATKQAASSKATGGAGGGIEIALSFTPEGTTLFEEATGNNVGKPIYILLDDAILSAPSVSSKISGGNAVITGSFTPQEAEELAALIRSGNLPFNLNVISMKNVGARLGQNSLATSLNAGLIGFGLVLLFMLIMYRLLGAIADVALFIFIGLELVALSLFGITLTLPGVAGIILSIGMAVDANIIIFERVKEELASGRSVRSAIDSGFSRAFPAILDGNVTTLIAAAVLFWLGTGPIKGFAQTLAIGIIISMFTALFITRIMLKNLVGTGVVSPKLYGAASNKKEAYLWK